jgi:hypothetical protein
MNLARLETTETGSQGPSVLIKKSVGFLVTNASGGKIPEFAVFQLMSVSIAGSVD